MVYNVNNTMRVSGLASGMDTESIVKELMNAERIPLDKMEQDKTLLTWKRDAFRDVNKMMLDLDTSILDMKLSSTYNSKSTTSSNSSAVTASAASASSNGSYSIKVNELATAAINVSQSGISSDPDAKIDPTAKLSTQQFAGGAVPTGDHLFYTFNEDGTKNEHKLTVTADDTLNSVLKKVSTASGGEVRAFYDAQTDKVVMERTVTGNFNKSTDYNGDEIGFGADATSTAFFGSILNIQNSEMTEAEAAAAEEAGTEVRRAEKGGTNAKFVYNNALEMESTKNSYVISDVTFKFNQVTDSAVNIGVSNNVDSSIDKVVEFVNKYNEMIEKVNGQLQEPTYREFKPLTEAQKEEMSDKEIEMWEEKAKSGLLKGENLLSGGLFDMRQDWYSSVENGGEYTHLTEIGITTSPNYRDNGKLLIDEDKLRSALTADPQAVHKLFSNDTEGAGRGIINRLEDSIEKTMERVEQRAGKGTQTLEQYTLGKQLRNLDSRIDSFEDKLGSIENRYWRQFTAMEKAIQQMNSQSSYLMQQFS